MTDRYYDTPRHDVLRFIPEAPDTVLEIGCGTGATLAELMKQRQPSLSIGVELNPDAATIAKTRFDRVLVCAVEEADFESLIAPGSLDLVLCLDVLEHLVDPWALVRRISPLLKKGGRFVLSVPNIRNWKFLRKLAFSGDFHYTDSGLLDRTHLRFFVRQTAESLATCGGLSLVASHDAKDYTPGDVRKLLTLLTFGATRDLVAKQWIVIAEKP